MTTGQTAFLDLLWGLLSQLTAIAFPLLPNRPSPGISSARGPPFSSPISAAISERATNVLPCIPAALPSFPNSVVVPSLRKSLHPPPDDVPSPSPVSLDVCPHRSSLRPLPLPAPGVRRPSSNAAGVSLLDVHRRQGHLLSGARAHQSPNPRFVDDQRPAYRSDEGGPS